MEYKHPIMITFSYGGGGYLRKIKAYLHKEVSLGKKTLKSESYLK